MPSEPLLQIAQNRTEELPGSELSHPFGADWEVFKVRGKVFMLITEVTGEPLAILKAHPADSQSLRDQYRDITPGYHMNKRHWITLHDGGELPKELIEDLVTESYLLVVEKLPRAQRPVDPKFFGRRVQ